MTQLLFDDGPSSYSLGLRSEGARRLTERETRWVLTRWLSTEPSGTQLRAFVEREIRVTARTDDALIDRMCALLDARGLCMTRVEKPTTSDHSTLDAGAELGEPLRTANEEDTTHWIQITVSSRDERPLAGIAYRLVLTDGRAREGRTDADGSIYMDEMPAGQCRLAILGSGRPTLPPGAHVVRQGECVSTIAARSGIPWRTIWEAPENESLRASRRHPNVLLPGDEIHVPKHHPVERLLATDRHHRIVVPEMLAKIVVRLVANLEPLPDEPWAIEHAGGRLEGTSDGEGRLEVELPVLLGRAALMLPKRRLRYTLLLGELDPVEERSGVHARLRNLAFTTSDRVDARAHTDALAAFQRSKGLGSHGELDEPTIAALREAHGS